jgi:hypothetical protein
LKISISVISPSRCELRWSPMRPNFGDLRLELDDFLRVQCPFDVKLCLAVGDTLVDLLVHRCLHVLLELGILVEQDSKALLGGGFNLRLSLVAGRRRNLQLVGFPLPLARPLIGVKLGMDTRRLVAVGEKLAAQRATRQGGLAQERGLDMTMAIRNAAKAICIYITHTSSLQKGR